MIFKKTLLLILFAVSISLCYAQEKTGDAIGKWAISPAFELLRSTHNNYFYAPSLKVNYLFKNGLEPGFGIEYATTPIHHDNGYTLYMLKFLPIYGNLKYNFKTVGKIRPYTETSLGLSTNKYNIADDITPNLQEKVSEQGFYTYLGFGAKYRLAKGFDSFLGIGFKGYKMSTNEYDINPHGISFSVGFSFY